MKLRHWKHLLPPQEGLSKVTASCFSPNNQRFAVVTTDRVVHLFDEQGEKRDKFSTKPADKATKAYVVTAMVFSPDSTRLLVAQSDNIVFVYKLGLDWADKKSICNKFVTTSAVTCAAWPSGHLNEIVFGCADGKVRLGALRTNKASGVYAGDSYVCSMASGPDGRWVLVGHVDGSIYRMSLESEGGGGGPVYTKLCAHSCPPYALAWGASVLAAGSDGRVCFYDEDGGLARTFDYSDDNSVRDLTCASVNPSGDCVVVGSYNKFLVFSLRAVGSGNGSSGSSNAGAAAASTLREWQEAGTKEIDHLYTVTSLAWKGDGSRLAVGNVTGALDIYDACLKRTQYRDKFDFTYVSPSTVIVKRLATGVRIVLRSSFGYEITSIKIFQDRFLIAHTPATLLMGDLESCKLSEVPWSAAPRSAAAATNSKSGSSAAGGGKNGGASAASAEKFFFDNVAVCMVYRAGELTLVEYGKTEVLGTCRTEHMSRHLVSVRVNERQSATEKESLAQAAADGNAAFDPANNKRVAYLLDAQSIHVVDLVSGATIAAISHDARVDWLELSGRGSFVLFRDKRRRLYLYDIARHHKATLLSYCNYAQWVPDSDVVVAQRRSQLCVWYNVRAADKMTTYEIKGDIEDVERGPGKTEVIVDEGLTTASYLLDATLIGFGTAMDDGDFEAACGTLETMSMSSSSSSSSSASASGAPTLSPEVEAMWQQLGQEAMRSGELSVAARCAAALGDVARARFLQRTLKIAQIAAERMGGDGRAFWLVRARLSQLAGDVAGAEAILLEQGRVDDAIEMHQQLHRYDDAIAVAEAHGKPDAASMRNQYFTYLINSGQEEKAGALKEQEGDGLGAITLYLRGGYPARALAVALSKPVAFPREVLERITAALATSGMYEKAGMLLERIGDPVRALEAYVRGHAFRPAVELARRSYPQRVVELEKAWGTWLVSQRQTEAAINHFIEAGANLDAITAAMSARQYVKAAQLVQDTLQGEPETARPFWRKLAAVYAERGALEEAERFYVRAGDGRAAVDLYLAAGKFDAAHRVARSCMSESDVASLYATQAQRMEASGNLRQAERLLVAVRAFDSAIAMYKRAKQWDSMVRLVAAHKPGALRDTHAFVAEALRSEGSLRAAERHYVEGGQWEAAVAMFKGVSQWEEATRVARAHGGPGAAGKVAYAHATSLGGEAGMKLLGKLGMIDQAIEYACDAGDWDRAVDMAAKHGGKDKLPLVHFKRAMKYEDVGQYTAAEQSFVAAEKPREAVDMYVHLKDWNAALRVAENYDPASIPDVFEAQGREATAARDFSRAEGLFLDAKRPDLAVEAWFEARQYPEALRVAKQYLPNRIAELTERVKRAMAGGGGGGAPPPSISSPSTAASSPDRRHRGAASGSGVGGVGGSSTPTSPSSDLLATARMWESTREYGRAIEDYLAVSSGGGYEPSTCAAAWVTAAQLAARFDKGRYGEVAEEVAHRLAEVGRLEQAGDLFLDIEQVDRAADCYVQAQAWTKAKEAARNGSQKLRDAVDAAHKSYLRKAGDPAQMAAAGAVDSAIAAYIAQGSMDKALELASKQNAATLANYIYPHAESVEPLEAISLLAKYGAPPVAAQLPLYRRLLMEAVSAPIVVAGGAAAGSGGKTRDVAVAELRDVLYKVVAGLRKQNAPADAVNEFDRLLVVAHYLSLRARASELGLAEVAARISVSLLRFVGVVPADRAFFEAGVACRNAGWKSMALVLLNRFIDLCEAIDDGASDASSLDNSDFVGTGIPSPNDMPLPRTCSVPERAREEVKEWVLSVSMDRKLEQVLNKRPCMSCGAQIFEACLGCPSCKAHFPSCIVTGYPMAASQTASCQSCGSKAQKSAWNAVVAKTKVCPWCAAPASTAL